MRFKVKNWDSKVEHTWPKLCVPENWAYDFCLFMNGIKQVKLKSASGEFEV